MRSTDAGRDDVGSDRGWYRTVGLTGAAVALGLVAVSLLPDAAILTLTSIPVEPIVLVAGLPLAYLALGVIGSRDPRRFVVGFVTVVIGWFAILYPNIAALPLPAALVNAYQGIVPTYLYAFQFPVSKIDRNVPDADPDADPRRAPGGGHRDLPRGRLLRLDLEAVARHLRIGHLRGSRRFRAERGRLRDRCR